jgi:heme O synthase-like polyprenyltransferase
MSLRAFSGCQVNGVPTFDCIPALFTAFITVLLEFAGIVALFLIIVSGISFVLSDGDPKKVDAARKTFVWAILGLFLIFCAFAIINLIAHATGASCIKLFGFDACT